jgi:hypothetical protein
LKHELNRQLKHEFEDRCNVMMIVVGWQVYKVEIDGSSMYFELQFHTPESIATKEETCHVSYEAFRTVRKRKPFLLRHFECKNDRFTKTGSGQTSRDKTHKRENRWLRSMFVFCRLTTKRRRRRAGKRWCPYGTSSPCRKVQIAAVPSLSWQMIVLFVSSENSKAAQFLIETPRATTNQSLSGQLMTSFVAFKSSKLTRVCDFIGRRAGVLQIPKLYQVRKRIYFIPKMIIFTKTGSGRTQGKHSKSDAFSFRTNSSLT